MALSGPSQNRKRSPLRGVKQTLVTRWTIPIGGGIGRIFKIGSQPLNATLQAYYDVEKPDVTGADWQLRAQLVYLFHDRSVRHDVLRDHSWSSMSRRFAGMSVIESSCRALDIKTASWLLQDITRLERAQKAEQFGYTCIVGLLGHGGNAA